MPDIQHLDLDSEEFEDAPKAVRDYAKRLKKELAARDQQITEYRSRETEQALTEVLAGFKSPNKVKRDLLADGVDPLDNEAVQSWIEENADDYARAAEQATPETPAEPVIDGADYDKLNVGTQFTAPVSVDKVETVLGMVTPEMDGEAVAALFRSHGI